MRISGEENRQDIPRSEREDYIAHSVVLFDERVYNEALLDGIVVTCTHHLDLQK